MSKILKAIWPLVLVALAAGCGNASPERQNAAHAGHGGEAAEPEPAKGPRGGRLFADGGFTLELAIFESGVPPEFRAWAANDGVALAPSDVTLEVTLTRLGNRIDEIGFAPRENFLRGDTVVYEPHSFVVSIEAQYQGTRYAWQYDSFEGRTRIGPEIAAAFGLGTAVAGPATIEDTVTVYGSIVPAAERVRSVSARFDGVVRSAGVSVGDSVRQGQTLATVESNDSLNNYSIVAPISGVVTERNINPGEQTDGRRLFTIMDTSSVWAELSVFPSHRARTREGAEVSVSATAEDVSVEGLIFQISAVAEPNQAVIARVVLDNADGALVPGMHVTGEIKVAEHPVPLAVKRTGLQSFRDFTVVFAQIGDEYEVRMLDLGRHDGEWIEVLGGLEPGTRYVTANSYLVKADIEKSGASHDH